MTTARLALALVGLMGALILGEGVARWRGDRLCTDDAGVVYRADARTGWGRLSDLRGRMGPCEPRMLPAVPATTNATGLLDEAPVGPKPPGVVRVLLLGGSAPEGLGVLGNHRVDAVVEQLADSRRGTRLEVINATVGSFALDNDVAWLAAEGAAITPDVVVVVVDPITEVTALSPTLIAAAGQRVPDKPFLTLGESGLAPMPPPGESLPPTMPAPPARGLAAHSALARWFTGAPLRSEAPLAWRSIPPPAPVELETERAKAVALVRPILARLQEQTTALGARLVVVLAPTVLDRRGDGVAMAQPMVAASSELGIPLLDLSPAFDAATLDGRQGQFPDSLHWSTDGHLVAGIALFQFLLTQRLFPPGIVPAQTMLSGTTWPTASSLPAVAAGAVRDVLDGPIGKFVACGLLAVFVMWMAAPLPASLRAWLLLALGIALAAVVAGPREALVGLAGVVVFHLSTRLGRVPGLAIQLALVVALVVGTVPLGSAAAARELGRERLLLALATNVLLLRLLALAAAWWRGRSQTSLVETLAELVFFPTLLAGPLVTPGTLGRLVRSAGAAPLVEAGGARLALGGVLVAAAVCEIAAGQWLFWLALPVYDRATATPAGSWAWLVGAPLTAYLFFAGLTDLGTGFARMLGLPLARSSRRPFLARTPGDFWRRWLVSFQRWVHHHVYLPLGGGRTPFAPLAVLAAFVASVLWYHWGALKLLGPMLYPPSALLGPLVWAIIAALGVAAGRIWEPSLGTGVGRVLGTGLTLVLVALAWAAFFLPGWYGLPELLGVYARLAGG
jgi:hypothetical protein